MAFSSCHKLAFSSCLKFYPFSISQPITLNHQSLSLKLTPPASIISFALSSSDVKLLDSLRSQPDDSAALRLFDLASKQIGFNGGEKTQSDRFVRRRRYSHCSKEASYSRIARFYPRIAQGRHYWSRRWI